MLVVSLRSLKALAGSLTRPDDNITLSIDDRLVEETRKLAQARGTSLNQLVRDYLETLVRPRKAEPYGEELRRLTAEGRGGSTEIVDEHQISARAVEERVQQGVLVR